MLVVLFMIERIPGSLNLTGIYKVYTEWICYNIRPVIIWGCVLHILFRLIIYRKNVVLIGITAVGAILLYLFGYDIIHTEIKRCALISAMLIISGCGRDYRTILKVYFIAHAAIILLGIAGLPFGITVSCGKLYTNAGTSLGLVYPNYWGCMFFIVVVTAWYLWFKDRPFIFTIICGLSVIPMQYYIGCTAVSLMLFIIALFNIVTWIRSKRSVGKAVTSVMETYGQVSADSRKSRIAMIIAWSFPAICLIVTVILGIWREKIFFLTVSNPLESIGMRFIVAGILLANYPITLFGYDMNVDPIPYDVFGEFEYSSAIVDNAYVYYLIKLGAIWMVLYMIWFAIAGCISVAKKDKYMFIIIFLMTGYGLIELMPFALEHNFIYFAAVSSSFAYKYMNRTKMQIKKGYDGI